MISIEDRILGSFFGLIVGDALGAPIELLQPGKFKPLTGMSQGGIQNRKKGEWTDDTSLALCLTASLTSKGYNLHNQMDHYTKWYQTGYLSTRGISNDIGDTTRAALQRYATTQNPLSGVPNDKHATNGCLSRIAPIAIFDVNNLDECLEHLAETCRTTHGATDAIAACLYLGGLTWAALHGTPKETILSTAYCPHGRTWGQPWQPNELSPAIHEIAAGSFKKKEPPAIISSTYATQTLEAALWAFHKSTTFENGALLAVNLGRDSDTVGAVYGQLAGAYYGLTSFPPTWVNCLTQLPMLKQLGARLLKVSQRPPNQSF